MGQGIRKLKSREIKSNNEKVLRTVRKSILTKSAGQGVFPGAITSKLMLKASTGMSQVKSNEILGEEIMFNFSELLRMKVLPLSFLELFSSLWQLQKQIFLHKIGSTGASLQLGWTLENWQPNLQIGKSPGVEREK